MQFDIPSQSLGMALQRYANETGTSVFFDNSLTNGKSSMPVLGTYTVEDALQRLLAGSGLEVRHTSSTSFTVVASLQDPTVAQTPVIAADNADTSGKPARSLDRQLARQLQSALEQALCKSPQTRPGRYRALIRLWLDGNGGILRGGVLGTTGLAERDRAINRVLSTLTVAGLASSEDVAQQPFTILLLPQSDKTTDVCMQAEEEY